MRRHTVTARIIEIACRLKAKRLGIDDYTIPQLEHDSKLNHSVIIRATQLDQKRGPTLETVKRLAQTLEVALDRELEDKFYNAFGYASPGQLRDVEPYVEQNERT
jgi:hypothetical protein